MVREAFVGGGTGGGAAGDANNPWGGSTSMVGPQSQVGYQVKLGNGTTIMVSSEADYLKLKEFYQMQQANAGTPTLGGGGGGSGGNSSASSLIDLAAEGFQAVGGFLAGSNYTGKLQEFQDSRDNLLNTRDALVKHRGASTDPTLVDLNLQTVDALLDHLDSAIAVLNTQITAVDMFAGGSAAKVVGRFVGGGSDGMMGMGGGSGLGTAAAIGAGALGLGLVLRNNTQTTNTRRRVR